MIGLVFFIGFELAARNLFITKKILREPSKDPIYTVDLYENLELIKVLRAEGIETAVFGDSHSHRGIAAEYFSTKSFNFSYTSQDLYYSNAMLHRLEAELPRLKNIILNVSYFSLGYQAHKTSNLITIPYSKLGILHEGLYVARNNLADPSVMRGNIKISEGPARADFNLAPFFEKSYLYRYRAVFFKKIVALLMSKPGSEELKTQRLVENVEKNNLLKIAEIKKTLKSQKDALISKDEQAIASETPQERARFHMDSAYDKSAVSIVSRYLDEFIRYAISRGIRVTLVTAPVRGDYFKSLRPQFISDFKKDIDAVLSKYRFNPDIKYIDYSADPRFTADDFMDQDHLNLKGAKKFTQILDVEISRP